jgi:hypothetical protein
MAGRNPKIYLFLLISLALICEEAGATITGSQPNSTGDTYIDQDTIWEDESITLGGNVYIGSSSKEINVTWRNCNITVNGNVTIGDVSQTFYPVNLLVDNCIITLNVSVNVEYFAIILDYVDSSFSHGSTLNITNSTIQGVNKSLVPKYGIEIRSGGSYKESTVQIDSTTFKYLGNYYATNPYGSTGAIKATGSLTENSNLKDLTFLECDPGLNTGDVFPNITGHNFSSYESPNSYLGIFMSGRNIFNNYFWKINRPVYDPPSSQSSPVRVHDNNIIGTGNKAVDFFRPYAQFYNNTFSYTNPLTFDGNGDNGLVENNEFLDGAYININVRSNTTIRDNIFRDGGYISDRGNSTKIIGNKLYNVQNQGIGSSPHPYGTYIYQNGEIINNTIEINSGWSYVGIAIAKHNNSRVENNEITKCPFGISVNNVSNSVFTNNTINCSNDYYGLSYGIKINNVTNSIFKNFKITTKDGISQSCDIYFNGANSNNRFINFTFDKAKICFEDDEDVFDYFNFLTVNITTHDNYDLYIYNSSGELINYNSTTNGILENVEVQEFRQTRQSTSYYYPYLFNITGFVPGFKYRISHNGIYSQTVIADSEGRLIFQENITGSTLTVESDEGITLSVSSPINKTYNTRNITIAGTTNKPANVTYSLNGVANLSICNECTSFSTWNDSAVEGINSMVVYAIDSTNSSDTDSKTIYFTVDTTPPTINFVPPTDSNDSTITRNYTFVNITLSEAASWIMLEWNGANETMYGSNLIYYKNKTNLANGTYNYRVYANDSAGNMNVSEIKQIKVAYSPQESDTTPPQPIFTPPTPNNGASLPSSTTSIQINISDVESNKDTYILNWNGVNESHLYSDFPITKPVSSSNSYSFYVWANDTAGNSNQTETRSFSVQSGGGSPSGGGGGGRTDKPPIIKEVNITPNPATPGDSITIFTKVTDDFGIEEVNVTIDGLTVILVYNGSSDQYWNNTMVAPMEAGEYPVNVTAIDSAGNLAYNDSIIITVNNTQIMNESLSNTTEATESGLTEETSNETETASQSIILNLAKTEPVQASTIEPIPAYLWAVLLGFVVFIFGASRKMSLFKFKFRR